MLFEFINKLFQNLKSCFNRLFSQSVKNVDEDTLVNGDELMAVGEKIILFTELQYKEFITKFPTVRPSLIFINTTIDGVTTYSLESMKFLKGIQTQEGKEAISDECIKYVKSIKSKTSSLTDRKKSQKSTRKTSSQAESSLQQTLRDEASILPEQEDKKDTRLINSPDLSIEHSNPQEVSEQTEKNITQEYVKLEKATSKTSESASITQVLATSEEFIDIQENLTTWNKWRRVFDAVVGSSHLRVNPPIPCQDSALSVLIPRPAIFVADGAGSARLSHFGSSAVVRYLNRFTASIEDINQEILDKDRQEDREIEKKYANRFIKYAIEILKELSEERQESFDLFRCTLLITIIGINQLFWLKVGDGFIVVEKGENLELLGPLGKGDFANQTTFLTEHLTDADVHYGFIDVHNVTGVAAFTDGAGEKLVSNDGLKISGALSKFFEGIRTREFTQSDLNQFLSNKEIWQRTTGDDKGIAILSSLL
ncbi:PP2C family serine/threonine-protein phosphatase [Nostoc sp.]|uniref:PP2C family serine/threonine-protein phosphatase n=1 Tax=Nostoc sp. TaxID=1180 RepID=UPI002FF6DF10